MGLDEETARGAQRFTLGHSSKAEDVDALLAALPGAYSRARQAGMAGHESSIQTAGTVARQGLGAR
jgi:cysteine desulfurase